jgi:mannan endo-1,4-beta-mannosidase
MKHIYKACGAMIAVLLLIVLLQPTAQSQASGFHISGRYLYDANGNRFIMRGIAHAHTWYPNETGSFANIKATGANTVRVVLSSGDRWTRNDASDVANVIQLCKGNKLICVLEVHDTTGYGEEGAAISLAQAVSYWTSIQSVLTGEEAYIIINIGNEPYGNTNTSGWLDDTLNAIAAMRSAGFEHTLLIDAPNWGQDWEHIMRDNAAQIFESDPDRNLVFDIHMYGVYDTEAEVESYLSTFVDNGLPLVIGEFGHNHSDGDPDEDAIMYWAEQYEIGYIGWSWSGNSGGVEYLDMVNNFDPNSLTSWGERIVDGANGIAQTSQECSVYGGVGPTWTPGPTATATATPSPTAEPGEACNPATAQSLPFSYDGSGEFCWSFSETPRYINSWNMGTLTVNGYDFTNQYAAAGGLPVKIDGQYYVYYDGNYAWSHFEAAEAVAGEPTSVSTAVPTEAPTAVPTQGPTAMPTQASTATPTPGGAVCTVDYDVQNDWGSGATVNVGVINNGSSAIDGWTLAWTFPGNQQISHLWGGSYDQSGASVSVTNASWNRVIGANGGSVSFGFNLTYSGSNRVPTGFTLNGTACQ